MKTSSVPPQLNEVRKGVTWRSLGFFYKLLEGDHEWAERRLFLLILMGLAFTLMGRATEQIEPAEFLKPILANMPDALRVVVSFIASLIYPQTLRHILPAFAGGYLAVRLASNYVRDLFEIANFTTARRYLYASMFGMDYPEIKISGNGYETDEKDDTNPIPKIGGPGFVNVGTGYVAVFERVGGPSKVAGSGIHFIRRFEHLREVIDLRDQFRKKDGIKVYTKDGIQVTVRNVEVAFRVHTQSRGRTEKELYPFSIGAVRRIAYTKTVGASGPSVWTDSATGAAVGRITGFIARNILDDIVAKPNPDSPDPRDKIKAIFAEKKTRDAFLNMGVDLLWVSIGHIETPKDVIDQRINAWRASWMKQERVELASGEATKVRLMEYARGLARIELLEKFTKGVPLSRDTGMPVDLILIQIAEVLNSTGRSHGSSRSFRDRDERISELGTLSFLREALRQNEANMKMISDGSGDAASSPNT
jgi:regulator of protease activity HflC (stomatin/prohibitin superfamily)